MKVFVHDGELKSAKFWMTLNQENSPLVEFRNTEHTKKSLEKIFNNFNKNKHFYSLQKHIIVYFAYLCKQSRINEKYGRWRHLNNKLREKLPQLSLNFHAPLVARRANVGNKCSYIH